jgi:hypothetical protein
MIDLPAASSSYNLHSIRAGYTIPLVFLPLINK